MHLFLHLLSLYSLFSFISCSITLTTFNPTFKDPYSTTDTLLDIDVNTPCVTDIVISVMIPTTSNDNLGNGHFIGTAFTNKILTGTSHWSMSVQSIFISFDGMNTLSFSGFVTGQTSGPGIKNNPIDNDLWQNFNFDVVDTDFITQTGLTLTLNDDVKAIHPNAQPFINLNVNLQQYFLATSVSSQCGGNTGVNGDPVFSGFQHQVFQFHGLPDEHFNLVSSPDVQLNAHFIYLSSGKCDYNDTECFTHPGTYMDVLGFSLADTHIKLVAGTHEQGLRLWIHDQEILRGTYVRTMTNTTAFIKYHHNGHVEIHTDIMNFDITNSDMFMNIQVALTNHELLHVGATHHTVTDHKICQSNTETHNHQLIEQTVAAKYPVNTPLHGLIGQTWRNVKVCNHDWMGTTQDYMTSDLFATDYHYNYFTW